MAYVAEIPETVITNAADNIEPLPLRRMPPASEPFPLDAMGSILGDAARTMYEVIRAPLPMCGQSVLAAASLAVQGHADVVIHGRVMPLSLYFVTIAESGDRKSAVDGNALWPHRVYERELAQQYDLDRDNYKRAKDAYDASYKQITSDRKTGREEKEKALATMGQAPQAPMLPWLLVEEPTYEGLVKLLDDGLPSVGLFSDEGGRLIGGHAMNKDNLLKTLAGFSNLWDGKPITRVRSGDGATTLYGRRMAFHLMIQPTVATMLFGNELASGQGFLSRTLPLWPASLAGTRDYVRVDITEEDSIKRYGARLLQILRSPLPLAPDKGNQLEPRRLPLSSAAMELWIMFYNELEPKLADGQAFAEIRGFANKAAEHASRIAGVLTLVDNIYEPEIHYDAMYSGIALTKFYLSEALRVTDAGATNPDILLAEKLLEWAQRHDGIIALQHVYQCGPKGIRNANAARRIIGILEDHGHVVRLESGMEIDGKNAREVWKTVA